MMHTTETGPAKAALLGDVIASRHSGDREQLQKLLVASLDRVNGEFHPLQPVAMTVGDEFQGLFAGLTDAIAGALRIRLAVRPAFDLRIGIGWGELTLLAEDPPFGQDGPCWWRARDAIDEAKARENSNLFPRTDRTIARTETALDPLFNAYLSTRDHIVSGLDEIDVEIARQRLTGRSQLEISKSVGLNQSSVSRRIQRHGISVLVDGEPTVIPVPV